MTCPHCHSRDVVEIRMQLHDEKVTMHSCPACERRWWDRGGESVGLRSVLDLAAVR
jgi:Zn-finger nucleic acid-binding protein